MKPHAHLLFFNRIFLFVVLVLSLNACSSARTNGDGVEDIGIVQEVQNPQSLADFLIRAPGVNIQEGIGGTTVTVRGSGAPLYVVDGVRIGHSYNEANRVINVNDIQSVEVLKNPSEVAIYGREGQNGVILIKTKTGG